MSEMIPVVYFNMIENDAHDYPIIKIGYTMENEVRLKDHQKSKNGMVSQVKPLAVLRANRADEKAIHNYFDKYNLKHKVIGINEKELFFPDAEIVDYIRWLRDQYFVWVPDCEERENLERITVIEPDFWMPLPERKKQAPPVRGLFQEFGPLNLPSPETTADDFYTNETVIETVRRVLGEIDLDPASHAVANAKVKAKKFFTIRDDGLSMEWSGRVWVNPPFSDWYRWGTKIVSEWKSGRISEMMVLAATRTTTAQYFFDTIQENCAAICLFRGRPPFWGKRAGSPDDGASIFYFGKDVAKFKREFELNRQGKVYIA